MECRAGRSRAVFKISGGFHTACGQRVATADLEGFAHSAAADGTKRPQGRARAHVCERRAPWPRQHVLHRARAIWQHVSACLGGGGWSRPAAGAGWMAETVRRLLADMWQNYTSGDHSKHIYTNACFRLVCLHLVNEC